MKTQNLLLSLFLAVQAAVPGFAAPPLPGENSLMLRGKSEKIFFYPAKVQPGARPRKVLYAAGDAGMWGTAIAMAQEIAAFGYDVYGLDTKRYLESFSDKGVLKEAQVMSDFREIAAWMTQGASERVTLIGWSEGAGLGLLAASDEQSKSVFNALVALGLPDSSFLAWHLLDDISFITKKDPKEPSFASYGYLPKVAPLPLVMIQSTKDTYVSAEAVQRMFALAGEPKRLLWIEAENHKFEGDRTGLFQVLKENLEWVCSISP